jgi:hypothetical protein
MVKASIAVLLFFKPLQGSQGSVLFIPIKTQKTANQLLFLDFRL